MNSLEKVHQIEGITLEELDQATMLLNQHVRLVTQMVRQLFAEANLPAMEISAKVSGNTHSDLKVTYSAGQYGAMVSGHDLAAVTREYLRRQGWDLRNAPTLISYTE